MEEDGFEPETKHAPETKPKRKLTQAQMDQLAKAREKANAVRKKNAETRQRQRQKEKQLAEMKRQAEEEELDIQLNRLHSSRQDKGGLS